MNITIKDVTPENAKAMLELNTNNFRNATKNIVSKYAHAMKLGFWEENGEPIQIYEDGTLANGQHRLMAIVESGVTLKNVVVITGIKKSVSTFDRGKTRTTVQQAKAKGINLLSHEIGAIGLIMNNLENIGHYESNELFAFYEKLVDFDVVSFATRKGGKHPITLNSSVIAASYCAYLIGKITLDEIETFSTICNTGLPIDGVCSFPPLCLRRTIQQGFKNKNGIARNNTATARIEIFESTYKAICDFVDNKPRQKNYQGDGRGKWIVSLAKRTAGIS